MINNKHAQMLTIIRDQIEDSVAIKQKMLGKQTVLCDIEKAAVAIISAFKENHKVMLAGNGGSAADAQHIAAELVNRFNFDRPGLPALALTTDTSILTAVSNDFGFDRIFTRQLKALGNAGDIFIALSTSGNSSNLVDALTVCRERKIRTIGLTGASGGKMNELCDICIKVPSDETPRIQEVHILIGHIICSIVEEKIFGQLNPFKKWKQ
jgi:D-sedoheptulose 7-phosphate isomerase